jgi:hypothetical protein
LGFESRRSLSLGTGLVVSLPNPCRFAPSALAFEIEFALAFEFALAVAKLGTEFAFILIISIE